MRVRTLSAALVLLASAEGLRAQQVRDHVTVDAVQIRVVASDASGKPLRDLSGPELTLRVDGRRVVIDSFELETATSERVPAVSAPKGAASAGTQARPAASVSAIVIDESTVPVRVRGEAIDQLLGFLESDSVVETTYLVCSYRHGSLRLDQPWTTDEARTRSTLVRLRDHPTIEGSLDSGTLNSRSSLLEFQRMRGRLLTALMQVIAMFPDGPELRQLVLVTGGKTLSSPLDIYGTLLGDEGPERAGTGAPGETAPDPSAVDTPADPFGDGFELWGRAVGGAAALRGNADLLAKAVEKDVALIPVAASAPDAGSYIDVGRKGLPSGNRSSSLSAQLSANQALLGLARETGVGSILLAGKAGRQLAALGDRAIYRMSFRYGPAGTGPARLHKVELASTRPGVTLDYRRGFRIRSPEERVLDSVVAHLALPPESPDPLSLGVSLSASQLDGRTRTSMALRYVPPDPGLPRRPVEIVAVGKAADGGWTMPIRWSGEARLTDDGVYEARLELGVAPGAHVWSIGLRDLLSSVDGFAMADSTRRP